MRSCRCCFYSALKVVKNQKQAILPGNEKHLTENEEINCCKSAPIESITLKVDERMKMQRDVMANVLGILNQPQGCSINFYGSGLLTKRDKQTQKIQRERQEKIRLKIFSLMRCMVMEVKCIRWSCLDFLFFFKNHTQCRFYVNF